MRYAGHVARMMQKRIAYILCKRIQKEKDH
jgi:hypothetical protein